jgi:hypothetical protein
MTHEEQIAKLTEMLEIQQKLHETAIDMLKPAIEAEREACAKLEIELILSPAFFATMGEYDAHKDAVLAYRNLIRARGQA